MDIKDDQKNFLLTKEGLKKLNDELRDLIDIKRPQIIKAIQEAREHGDLSENADYDAAKNQQAEIERRINEIKNIILNSQIISNTKNLKTKIRIGSKVTIYDLKSKKNYSYEIVGQVESDPENNKISNLSPLAKSTLGHCVNDTVEIRGIEDPYKVKIIKITN